jgi:hypothetical protein
LSDLELKLLDPLTDLDLFREAYNWRTRPKKHVQPDRMPFEVFSSADPSHIAVGAFNGEFLAVFFFHEFEPGCFEAHFTSKRGVSRETLLTAARETMSCFFENGARELTAWIVERNRPLRSFVESLGFAQQEGVSFFPCAQDNTTLNSVGDERNFVKYAIQR